MRRGAALLLAALLLAPAASAETVFADDFEQVYVGGARAGRTTLTHDFLTSDDRLGAPVNLAEFAPQPGAVPADARFEGRLSFEVSVQDAGYRQVSDAWSLAGADDQSYRLPPPFEVEFIQVDDRLVPKVRGSQPGSHAWWEWIVGPGRTWREPGDGDWMRAAVPFALQERNANCMHNGVLTFLYRGAGEVSRVAYQVSQETCMYFKFDAWGTAQARWQPQAVAGSRALADAFRRELSSRMPVRPMAALADDHPGVDPSQFGAPQDVAPQHMTAFGLVVGGQHYAGGCETRAGPYPFCDEMLLPSYSLAKTLAAGLGLMRLELLHPGARQALVADYVPDCARAGDWDDVTFDHLLDMASGRYHSTEREADENTSTTHPFFLVESHAEKIAIACSRFPPREPPGRTWVYHTSDTYILGTAMQAFWRRHHGEDADFYRDVLAGPVWHRLGLSPEVDVTRRTADAVAQPFMGWGLTLRRDDVARLGEFLNVRAGVLDAEPLLAPAELRAALQRSPSDPGLPAAGADFRYNNGVWAWNAGPYLKCDGDAWIPFMSGFGGISVVLVPNGVVYYYFSDNGDFRWARAVAESQKFGAICAAATP